MTCRLKASFSLGRLWGCALSVWSGTASGVAGQSNAGVTVPVTEAQMKSDAGLSAWAAAFLLILFSSCCCASVSSNLERPFYTVDQTSHTTMLFSTSLAEFVIEHNTWHNLKSSIFLA